MLQPNLSPANLESHLVFSDDGAEADGLTHHIFLLYQDGTVDPPRPEVFHHTYRVTGSEYDAAVRQGRLQQLLLIRRQFESERFLDQLARDLREKHLQLIYEDKRWLLRLSSSRQ
jgi:hypothetical protein